MNRIALTILLFICSCSKTNQTLSEQLMGIWKQTKEDIVITFKDNNQLEVIEFGGVMNTTYSITKDSILTLGERKFKVNYLSSDTLKLTSVKEFSLFENTITYLRIN